MANTINVTYHDIDEATARTAWDINHFDSYTDGRITRTYRANVDAVAAVAQAQADKYPDETGKLQGMVNSISRRLADWYNKSSRVDAMCPSVMISGAGNFPVAKKQKQNERRDSLYAEWQDIQNAIERLKTVGEGGIQSDDVNAIAKLKKQLAGAEECQEAMKAANAYYRKHGTLEGCNIDAVTIKAGYENIAFMRKHYNIDNPMPFASFTLSNNNAEIHRLRERIETLKADKVRGTVTHLTTIDGLTVVENAESMRVQLVFLDKPDEATRGILKSHGFRWAPSAGAWQRQLNNNGRYAAKQVVHALGGEIGKLVDLTPTENAAAPFEIAADAADTVASADTVTASEPAVNTAESEAVASAQEPESVMTEPAQDGAQIATDAADDTPRDWSELTGQTVKLSAWAGGPLKQAVIIRVDDNILTYSEDNGASYSLLPIDQITLTDTADGVTISWAPSRDTHAYMRDLDVANDMPNSVPNCVPAVPDCDTFSELTPVEPFEQLSMLPMGNAGSEVASGKAARLQTRRAHIQERIAAGELSWVGQVINGHGWSISADGDACKIIVRIDAGAGNRANVYKAREAVKAAGWYYTGSLNTWTRGLRCKGWRAAQALASTLTSILG